MTTTLDRPRATSRLRFSVKDAGLAIIFVALVIGLTIASPGKLLPQPE